MFFTKNEGFADLAKDPGDKSFLGGVKVIGSRDNGHGLANLREGILVR